MTTGILIEGYTPAELLSLPVELVDRVALTGEPIAFRAGTATLLGSLSVRGDRLVVELAHIGDEGEGVLLTIWNIARELARRRRLHDVEWIFHAVTGARPNEKLRRVLRRRSFEVEGVPDAGDVYRLVEELA